MANLGERLIERLEVARITQTELARRVGVTQPAISHLLRRGAGGSAHLHKIARELGTSPAYLSGETDDPDAGASPTPSPATIADQLGMTMIEEADIAYSMGGGSVVGDHVESRMVPFRTDWLRRLTRGGPADVFLTHGQGDSMMPTILDGDDVLVNRADRVIGEADRIWAVAYGELGMLKRVRRTPTGMWQLNSDNPSVRPIDATEDEMHVVGRVIWVGRRI